MHSLNSKPPIDAHSLACPPARPPARPPTHPAHRADVPSSRPQPTAARGLHPQRPHAAAPPPTIVQALVQFRPGSGPVARGRALGRGGGAEAEVVVPAAAGRGPLVRATFGAAAGKSTAKAAKRVADDPAVEFVEVRESRRDGIGIGSAGEAGAAGQGGARPGRLRDSLESLRSLLMVVAAAPIARGHRSGVAGGWVLDAAPTTCTSTHAA